MLGIVEHHCEHRLERTQRAEMPQQPGRRDTGMDAKRDHGRVCGAQPAVEFEREQQDGKLALRLEFPALISLVCVQIVEVDTTPAVIIARLADHPSPAIFGQLAEQQPGQRKMAQVVDG
ncbi:hypothetical protein, partial [Enterococcus faecalis]|uniref:hypothetical protein n=1 Tax=Enterococcus faecalis TaxID=1351 RepID=UPI000A23799D